MFLNNKIYNILRPLKGKINANDYAQRVRINSILIIYASLSFMRHLCFSLIKLLMIIVMPALMALLL